MDSQSVCSLTTAPGIGGLTLLAKIKQHFPELPVMMVTAYWDDQRRRSASNLGACEFIAKPVDFNYLKARINQRQTP